MKRRTAIAAVAAVAGLCAFAAVAARVVMHDWLMPRSSIGRGYAAALDYSILTANLSAMDALAKKKHGPEARAIYSSDKGLYFQVGDQIVEHPSMPREIIRIYGLIAIGRGEAMQRFPYSFIPPEDARQKRDPVTHERLRRFHSRAPEVFGYTDSDWRLEECRTVATPSVGLSVIDDQLKLGSSDVCVIRWLKEPQRTMLVGGVVAEGGTWIQRWIIPLCRVLSNGWLSERTGSQPIDYVACHVIYDPHHPTGGPRDLMAERIYHVQDGRLEVVQ